MAVTDESLYQATDSLVLSKPRPYYRAAIKTSHWQLRSLISAPEKQIVFYPSGSDIYALYTKSKERELITTLPFRPLCVTAAGGWLCCGGHHGNYTAISLIDEKKGLDLSLDPDARLPLDLDSWRTQPRDIPSTLPRPRRQKYPLFADVKKVGHEDVVEDAINNCISLWFPKTTSSEKTYKSPVAVIANNDHSVYILNLEDSEILERFTYPDCVNRAVMSPDGEMLCAVLDDPFLYIHQRRRRSELTPGLFSAKEHYEWVPACRIQLHGQTHADKSDMRGAFALAFSSSGKYLAVATQHGSISVFDVATITDENAEPISIFTSSRPGLGSGAVRAMEFSPGPFDLLAYTESDGKVAVADLRNLFVSRQLLQVDSQLDGVERIYVSEKPAETAIDPRLRIFRNDSPTPTPDYLGLDFERRQARQMAREMLDRHQAPLTSEEMDVLQAHRFARRQRDALAEASRISSWGTSAAWGQSSLTPAMPGDFRDFVGSDRTAASLRQFINERNQSQDRERRQHDSRTRSAMLVATAQTLNEQETANPSSARNGNEEPSDRLTNMERLTLTLPRLLVPGTDTPSNPWDEIDALYRSRYSETTTLPPIRRRIDNDDEDRQVFARLRLRRLGGDMNLGSGDDSNIIIRGMPRRSDGGSLEIMGISWSPDGRILYVGAEDGIYEYHVNVGGRKIFPSIVFR